VSETSPASPVLTCIRTRIRTLTHDLVQPRHRPGIIWQCKTFRGRRKRLGGIMALRTRGQGTGGKARCQDDQPAMSGSGLRVAGWLPQG
jgi:hypothetical protein